VSTSSATVTAEVQATERARSRRRSGDVTTITLLLLPATLLYLIFLVYPIGQAVYYSLFNWKGLGPAVDFVWFNNYVRLFSDKVFVRAVSNALIIGVLSISVQLPLALIFALLVGRDLPGRAIFRAIFFLPYVLSEVMTAIIWRSLLDPNPHYGFVNAILVGVGFKSQAWLGDPGTVLGSIFAALTWKYFGLYLLLYMAGLQNVPREMEEAAQIDGANSFQVVRYITIPMLGSTIRLTVLLSILGSLQQFGVVWVMTQGGPVDASQLLATYLYKSTFIRFAFGYGSALALIIFLMCLAFSIVYQRLALRQDYEGIGS
jgi:raffinose/stachyose/melibiose transport system permease protein